MSVTQGFRDSAITKYFAQFGKLCRICKYVQNFTESDVFPKPSNVVLEEIPNFVSTLLYIHPGSSLLSLSHLRIHSIFSFVIYICFSFVLLLHIFLLLCDIQFYRISSSYKSFVDFGNLG